MSQILRPVPELIVDGDRRIIAAGDFRLAFTWTGDRWAHSLEHRAGGQSSHRILATSIEGDPNRDDPARVVSPAYQDIQFQEGRDSTFQALLVGQSGPHHFSAVFTVSREVIEGEAGRHAGGHPSDVHVEVDLADRCREAVAILAGTYLVEARSGDLINAEDNWAAWNLEADSLNFVPELPARFAIAEAGRRATRVQAFAIPKPNEATHRLRYSWIWEQDYISDNSPSI